MIETDILNEIRKLREEVSELRKTVGVLTTNTPGPIPGKRCTIHTNCSGGSMYCNDGGPITDHGIGW